MHLALQAGAKLADMELVQFHPTGMVAPESIAGTLVTEAVRGEGGHLLNIHGERFMSRYDPARMELSARDRVALANYTEIIEGRGGPNGGVFLDISHRDKDYILEKLPRMYRQFIEHQLLDISQQPMEVAPTAHYTMGGVMVEAATHATSVQGLYAAGEVTSRMHGANRLGGNSLAETMVFGRYAGEAAAKYALSLTAQYRSPAAIQAAHEALDQLIKPGGEMARPLQRAVRDVMWEYCGVMRSGDKLALGLEKLQEIKVAAEDVDVRPSSEGYYDLAYALDLRSALTSAEATIRGAIARQESRGAHQHTDFPDVDPALRVNFTLHLDDAGNQVLESVPVAPIPSELRAFIDEGELEIAGRLLE